MFLKSLLSPYGCLVRLTSQINKICENYSVPNVVKIPISINETFFSDHAGERREAVACEMNSIKENDVYDVVKLPQGKIALIFT